MKTQNSLLLNQFDSSVGSPYGWLIILSCRKPHVKYATNKPIAHKNNVIPGLLNNNGALYCLLISCLTILISSFVVTVTVSDDCDSIYH